LGRGFSTGDRHGDWRQLPHRLWGDVSFDSHSHGTFSQITALVAAVRSAYRRYAHRSQRDGAVQDGSGGCCFAQTVVVDRGRDAHGGAAEKSTATVAILACINLRSRLDAWGRRSH